jgi:hypothetical protein
VQCSDAAPKTINIAATVIPHNATRVVRADPFFKDRALLLNRAAEAPAPNPKETSINIGAK